MTSTPATLHLCFGEADSALLSHHQVFAQRSFAFQRGQVSLFVIGASSIILVETDGSRLAELIACGTTRGGFGSYCEAGLALQPGSEGRVTHQSTGIAYSGEIHAEALSAHQSSNGALEMERLSYRFPTPGQPLTEIEACESEAGLLRVRTVHEYPEHGVRVLSRSRWEFL